MSISRQSATGLFSANVRRMKTILLCALLFLFTGKVQAGEQTLYAKDAEFSFSFESLKLDEFNNENMGLFGGNFLIDLKDYPWLSLGAATYGSLTGERGGFITLGLASDAHVNLRGNLSAHAGLFVGAGGGHGGYQLQGGGLMLRGHLGLSFDDAFGNLGLGLSRVAFPNGHVDSSQMYASYAYGFQSLIADGWSDTPQVSGMQGWAEKSLHQFGVVYRMYDVPVGVKNSAGKAQYKSIGLLGVEWQHEVNDNMFVSLETEGAMAGKSNGYMQILLGVGLHYPLMDNLRLKLSGSAGVAGGGNVDTGGGLLTDLGLGLQANISDDVSVEVEAGLVDSLLADFKARSFALKLNQSYSTPLVLQGETVQLAQLQAYDVQHMRVRFVHQSYFKPANATTSWRSHHAHRDVNLLGFQNDYFINDYVFLSGQGIAAYEGQAGGYMAGLVGGGFVYPLTKQWAVEMELLAGAAGGGGLAVGGGLVWQVNAGVSYHMTDDYSVLLEAGRIAAVKGAFVANVASVSTAYHFSLFMD